MPPPSSQCPRTADGADVLHSLTDSLTSLTHSLTAAGLAGFDAYIDGMVVRASLGQRGDAAEVLRQVAVWLVPGAGEVDPLSNPDQAEVLVELARSHKLTGPLLVAVDAGALHLPADQVQRLVDEHEKAMLWCMRLETALLDVAEVFERGGVSEFRVLKGGAAAHLDEPDPSLRFTSDLDLLVRSRDFDAAVSALMGSGATRTHVERRPGFDHRFAKGLPLKRQNDRVTVDLHRTLVQGPFAVRTDPDRLFDDPEPFEVGGQRFLALPAWGRVLNSAYHAAVNGPIAPLRNLRDLAQYLSRPDLEPEVVAAEAARWRGEAVLERAVRLTLESLPVEIPVWEQWLESVEVDPADRALLLRGHRPSRWPVQWATLREMPLRDRAAYLFALAVPSAEYRRAEGDLFRRRISRVRNLMRPAPV